jgi:small subunit ribosomal protein S17
MAEDETNENTEQTPAEEPQAPEAEAAPEAQAQAPTPEPEAVADTPPAEPAEVVPPKERRRRARSAKAAKAPARASRTPEERHADRIEERRAKATARRTTRLRQRSKAAATPHATETIAPREHGPGKQKTRQGVVVSDKADKTITVRIDITRRHRQYKKIVRTSNTLHAHDESNDAHTGDTVIVRESRPLSRTKRWRLVEVVERAR